MERKLDRIAKSVLEDYDAKFKSIEFFSKETSSIYEIINENGEKFALKIFDDLGTNIIDNQIEILILQSLQAKSNLITAEILKNNKDEPVTFYSDEQSQTTYRTIVSRWIEGNDFKNHESLDLFYQLGKTLAELHQITKEIVLPEDCTPKKWDKVFYFRDEVAVYKNIKYKEQVSEEFKTLMDKAIPLFDEKLESIYQSRATQLLHGDLNPWNIKVIDSEIALLDFEDAIMGAPIHDIAILLHYYKDDKKFSNESVKEKVIAGYNSISPIDSISDDELKFLSMARTVNFLNYVLNLEDDHGAFIEKSLVQLRKYLESNSL